MSWIVAGITAVSVGSSVYGNTQQNKAQKKQNEAIRTMAKAQASLKSKYLEQSNDIKINDLLAMTQDIDNAVGLELTNLLYNSEASKGEIVNTLADRNVYGNSATRAVTTANVKTALSNDTLQAKVAENYKAINSELDTTRLNFERDSLDIQLGLAGALSQQNTNFKSDFAIGMEGVTAGLQGYQMGSGLVSSMKGVDAGVGSIGGTSSGDASTDALFAKSDTTNWFTGE